MYHTIACLTVPKLSYLGEHSEVSQARSLHACGTRMLYHDRLETIENSQKHKLRFGLIKDNVTVFQ